MTTNDNEDRAALLRAAVEMFEQGDLRGAIEAIEEADAIGGNLPEGWE